MHLVPELPLPLFLYNMPALTRCPSSSRPYAGRWTSRASWD